jgi:hypothetical protein
MFSANEEIEELAVEILRKMELTMAGKSVISTMNYFYMLKY